jgi:hypothetical protein
VPAAAHALRGLAWLHAPSFRDPNGLGVPNSLRPGAQLVESGNHFTYAKKPCNKNFKCCYRARDKKYDMGTYVLGKANTQIPIT